MYMHTHIQCVQKVWKHPNKIETNDFREKRKNRWTNVFKKLSAYGICLLFLMTLKELWCHQRFFKWQCHIFTTVFNRSFNCLPDGQKNFQFT
jgi:hypothetical protein